jgi:hypothetical protein
MSVEYDTTSVNHLLTLCHSYTEEGFVVEEKNINFKVVGDSLFMHSYNQEATSDYKEFSCEVFNVHNPITNQRIGTMIHYTNKNVFRIFYLHQYIGHVVKFFIRFQSDMDKGIDSASRYVIFED